MSNEGEMVYRVEDALRRIERLTEHCDRNTKRLNMMMLELKGLVARVRPEVKKSGWYGEEIQVDPIDEPKPLQISVKHDIE